MSEPVQRISERYLNSTESMRVRLDSLEKLVDELLVIVRMQAENTAALIELGKEVRGVRAALRGPQCIR